MIKYILIILFTLLWGSVIPQEINNQEMSKIIYYGKDSFILEGTAIPDSIKESLYDRLPVSYKDKVRAPVWDLSKCSAGLTIRFLSNSTSLRVKWTVLNDFSMNHMAASGIKGIDLYTKNDIHWQYVNTARPYGKVNEALLVQNMTQEMREYKMFLPLYDGLTNLEIGIDPNSVLKKPATDKLKPIVFYGTSITQGGCASRPGMAHTNIISRKLNIDCINFGFSGNGKMEQPIVELISEIDACFYIIECLPNMTADEVKERSIPLVETIREKRPNTSIIFVENFIYERSFLDNSILLELENKNVVLRNEYQKMLEKGFKNILYLNSINALGKDHEGTVDGVHFTDLGFLRYADYLINNFEQFGLLKTTLNKE